LIKLNRSILIIYIVKYIYCKTRKYLTKWRTTKWIKDNSSKGKMEFK